MIDISFLCQEKKLKSFLMYDHSVNINTISTHNTTEIFSHDIVSHLMNELSKLIY